MLLESIQEKLRSQIDKQNNVANRIEIQIELINTDVTRSILTRGAANVRKAHLEKALIQVHETIQFLQSFYDNVEMKMNNNSKAAV